MNPSKNHSPTGILVCALALTLASYSPLSAAACNECGTVTDVKTIRIAGRTSGVGVVAGGVVGGVLGHQVGSGTGNDLATIGGAVGGAYVGHQMEKKSKRRTVYRVVVEMADGTSRTFRFSSPTSYKIGDSVMVKNGKLVRP